MPPSARDESVPPGLWVVGLMRPGVWQPPVECSRLEGEVIKRIKPRPVRELDPNADGELLEPGQVSDCYLGAQGWATGSPANSAWCASRD